MVGKLMLGLVALLAVGCAGIEIVDVEGDTIEINVSTTATPALSEQAEDETVAFYSGVYLGCMSMLAGIDKAEATVGPPPEKWRSICVANVSGNALMDSHIPYGHSMPDLESLKRIGEDMMKQSSKKEILEEF